MPCCLRLFVGFAKGSTLGGPLTFIVPATGFGLSFMEDRKLMRGSHGGRGDGHTRSKKVEKEVRDSICGIDVNEKQQGIRRN